MTVIPSTELTALPPPSGPRVEAPVPTHTDASDDVFGDDDRMNRNAFSLIASSVVTSLFGFAFWIVAARTLPTEAVGTGTALVAALVLLGNMSTLGLRNALPRFLPASGQEAGSMIARSYAACAGVGLVVAAVFIAGAPLWADELTVLQSGWAGRIGFAVAVAAWAVFVLQDAVLIGLRRAIWVPVENLAYAVIKLVMLVLIAATGGWALLVAWTVPAVAIMVPLNVGIFSFLVAPSPRRGNRVRTTEIDWRSIGRFAAGDHFADIVRYIGAEGVVLITLAKVGPASSAPLFFALTIAASLSLVSSNVMSAFVAEAAARPHDADALLARAGRQISVLVVPGALIAAVGAPIGLALFGSEYVDDGTTVLRLLLLAAIPQIAISMAIGLARFERRVSQVVRLAAATATGPVIGAIFFAPTAGIVAVGWAVLVGNSLIAVYLLATALRPLWAHTSIGGMGDAGVALLLRVRRNVRQSRRERAAATMFDELDATRDGRVPLEPRSIVATDNDVVVAMVAGDRPLVVKVALTESASAGLARHATALSAMRRATAGTRAQDLLPELVEIETCMGQTYVVESRCDGLTPTDPSAPSAGLLRAIASAFGSLHRATGRLERPGDDLAYHLVTTPTSVLLADPRLPRHRETIQVLAERLRASLWSRQLQVARTHGDCWVGNVLVSEGPTPEVTGVIDWEDSVEVGLPDVDLAHLWLSAHPNGFAAGTLEALGSMSTFADLAGPIGTEAFDDELPAGVVVTLAWLSHIAAGLSRSSRFSLGRLWIGQNVSPVLDAVAAGRLERLIE